MMSADLMTDSNSSASSMRTAEKTCLYPSTTSMAVKISNAPQTHKYCVLLPSCVVATLCISSLSLRILSSRNGSSLAEGSACLRNLRRHQIDQREDEHPHQIDEVPIQSRDFHVMRVVILRLQEQHDRSYDQPDQQGVNQVVKNVVGRNEQKSRQPNRSQNRQKQLAQ